MGLRGGYGDGIGGCVPGTCGIDAFRVGAGNLDEGGVLDAVIGEEGGFHALLAHLHDDGGSLGMIAAVNDGIGFGPPDLLDDCRIVHGARRHPFKEDDFGHTGRFDELFGEFRQALPVIALVMENGDPAGVEAVEGEIHLHLRLGVIGGDGPEEIGVPAALGQLGIRRRRGDRDDPGILVDPYGRFRRAAADMADDGMDLGRDELGRGVGRHFRFAGVVFNKEFDLPAQNAPLGVDVLDHQLRRLDRGQSVRGQVAAVSPGDADPDVVCRRGFLLLFAGGRFSLLPGAAGKGCEEQQDQES
ncbi:MAG: hypothetical protein A4E70_02658 [Syntrophus sp. PtaU1.Bin005]|nr:MAG: hypothetical protein A4E70_02658 [Syntrophus sp. PtaU1.Bin005]